MRKPPGGGLIIPDSKDVADFAKEGPISLPGNLPPPETTDVYEGATYMPPPKEKFTGLSADEMIAIVRARAKPWYELSHYIQALTLLGISPTKIADATGVSPIEQSNYHVQSFVYDSLEENPEFPKEKLAYFNNPQLNVLLELRELTDEERPAAAEYCVDRRLTPSETRELRRAYVLQKLFPKETTGFTDHPGDRLAYKYWRTGIEFQRSDPDKYQDAVTRGLKYAHSPTARARLEALRDGALRGSLDAVAAQQTILKAIQASLPVVALGPSDTHWRCLPVLGPLGDVPEDALQAAPLAAPAGAFRTFRPSAAHSWVTVPNWSELQGVTQPCFLEVTDPSAVGDCPPLAALQGPCLLLISPSNGPPTPDHFYVGTRRIAVLSTRSGLEVVSGGVALASPDWRVSGRILLAVAPATS